MKYFLFIVFIGYFLLFISCKKYQPAPAAFFITTDKVSVSSTTLQGSSSQNISDLYLYVNGKFQGAYPVGHTMPIITNNASAKIDVFAGIKNNGIKDLSITWLFYQNITFDTLVESGKTISRPLTFTYNPNVKFTWMENFDNPIGFSLVKSASYTDSIVYKIAATSESFEGKSIEFGLNGNGYTAQVESSIAYALPKGNSNVYLEINYKCNNEFLVGLTDGVNLKPGIIVKPKSNWNKIYIQLASAVNDAPQSNSYKVFFRVLANENPNARVWLDNIKLIYL
ncbi:MAG: hypothetical protein H0W61_05520 [Bacteroidetes bacterium]|nr:hypothetical protein [Bacteroidota bacterium]